LSQKRARLRALASLGLSIVVLGALAPATAAASSSPAEALAPFVVTAGPVSTVTLTPTPDSVARNADSWIDGDGTAQALSGRVIVRSTPSPVAARITAASRIVHRDESHIGARYQHGATGPHAFDCSGLVYRVFRDAGLGRKIDGLESASGLYAHFRALHMTSTHNPQPGDLVIFGGGRHVGIYIGSGKVIHAMTSGVAITRVSAVYPKFTTYVHLGLTKLFLSH
jgi:cell wall-associated NlpC family hydrolase